MKLYEVLSLINSAHYIVVKYELKTDFGFESATEHLQTTLKGNLISAVDATLLNSEVRCIYPYENELHIILEDTIEWGE
jgi:hypothetical protein